MTAETISTQGRRGIKERKAKEEVFDSFPRIPAASTASAVEGLILE